MIHRFRLKRFNYYFTVKASIYYYFILFYFIYLFFFILIRLIKID